MLVPLPPVMQGPIPLRVPSGPPRGASLSKPSLSDHFWSNPQLSGRKSGSSSKSLPEFERRSLGEGSNAIFKEILMVGISGIISKTERGHAGTGSLGRSPQRSASSLEASQRSHSSPLLLAQGSRSVPCSQPAELSLRLPSVGRTLTRIPLCQPALWPLQRPLFSQMS